jgi:hypothetical protein
LLGNVWPAASVSLPVFPVLEQDAAELRLYNTFKLVLVRREGQTA